MLLAKIPLAAEENSVAWICVASASAATARPSFPSQYRITIDKEAEPQPSVVCCTKGTSIQIARSAPAGIAGAAHAETPNSKSPARRLSFIRRSGEYCNQNYRNHHNTDQGEDSHADHARGIVLLCFLRSCRQARQVGIVQLADRVRHLLRIDSLRLHRFLDFFLRKKSSKLLLIALARRGRRRDVVLDLSGRNNVVLSYHRLRSRHHTAQQQCRGKSQFPILQHFHLFLQTGDGSLVHAERIGLKLPADYKDGCETQMGCCKFRTRSMFLNEQAHIKRSLFSPQTESSFSCNRHSTERTLAQHGRTIGWLGHRFYRTATMIRISAAIPTRISRRS